VYVKTTKRENKSGTVRYLHLAHNEWDPAKGRAVPKVLFTFGREDQLDRDAVKRLVASLSKLLEPGDALASTAASDLEFTASVPFGGTFVLDHLWHRLKIDQIVGRVGQRGRGRRRDMTATERVLFALVANRALAPSSKLAAAEWITHDAHIDGLPEVGEQPCYRAMDWLHEVTGEVEKQVFDGVAHLLNLDVDLLFFDTTSTYFELEEPDEPVARDDKGRRLDNESDDEGAQAVGFRVHGKSKDSRDDLPQIVIGMAVTRDGIPVRCWCWPGNASDQTLIRQVKDDMRDWTLSKIVWWPTAASPPRPTAATCAVVSTPTSSARSSAPDHRRSRPPCHGRAATRTSPRTCASRRCGSATRNGSSSATTPRPPSAISTCAPNSWPSSKS
jgi:hypothetical protein